MTRAVIFGGTSEGRKLCAVCSEHAVPVVYCVATADGARAVQGLSHTDVRAGRLTTVQMAVLLDQCRPDLVVDATHPYAEEASRNIAAACQNAHVQLLRVIREASAEDGCVFFAGVEDLLAWLEREPGNIFATTGSSFAKAFTRLPDYQKRVWLRILPSLDSLGLCLDSGYGPERLICMQGPFSEDMNRAMFQAANARIMVTKNSGEAGGFPAKARAAHSLGMLTAVLAKPLEPLGFSLEEASRRLIGLRA